MAAATSASSSAASDALLAGLLAALCYANALHGSFVIDDGSAIRTNADLRPETPLRQLLFNDFWGRPIDSQTSVKSYRPLTVLSFRWNFALHGLRVEGYHAANVALHAVCTALVVALARRLLPAADARVGARVAAAVFAVHPVHTEAVASIVGRAELLCGASFFGCVLAHERAAAGGGRAIAAALALALAYVCAALATLAKETGLMALPVACALDVARALGGGATAAARRRCAARCALAAAASAAALYASRWVRGGQLSPHFSFVDNPLPSAGSALARTLSALHVHVRYARLLVWPATLSADYSFECVPLVRRWRDARNLGAAALYALLAGGAAVAWRDLRRAGGASTRGVAAGRCLVLLVVPMAPASHLLFGVGTTVAERLLYIPSAGYSLLVGLAIAAALDALGGGSNSSGGGGGGGGAAAPRRARRATAAAALVAVLGVAAARTWARNDDWRDSDAISAASAAACTSSAKAQLSLGTTRLQHGDAAAARAAFRRALAIHPEYADALYWLGRLAWMRSELPAAERLLGAALERNAVHPEALLFAGLCAARRRDDAAAVALLGRAHAVAPHNAEVVRDYGALLFRANRTADALPLLRRAVAMFEGGGGGSPGHASAETKLAAALLTTNAHAECAARAARAAALDPPSAAAVAPLRELCERAAAEGLDTSAVTIEMAM